MMAADGLLETFLTVLSEMVVYPQVIAAERDRYLPFLATTTILMEAVRRGAGRESAHKAIQEHALAAAAELRKGGRANNLLDRLAADPRVGLGKSDLDALLASDAAFIGAAREQADGFVVEVEESVAGIPEARTYLPGDIL
jgi:adenylosuccinate lyase